MEQKTAFITGITGLLGARLAFDLHEKGYIIKALKRENTPVSKLTKLLKFYTSTPEEITNNIQFFSGDVLDLESIEKGIEANDIVFHCAAKVSFNPKETPSLMETNVQGTANLVNICLEKGVKKLCHVSSIAALGTPVFGEITDTNSPWTKVNKSPYSISKHESELEVWRGIAEGLSAVIVNPAVILGAGDWENSSAAFFSRIAKGMKFYTKGSTGYVSVNDVSNAMIKLAESEIVNERFILSAETVLFKNIFEAIAKGLNVNAPKKLASPLLTAFAWRAESLRTKLFGGEPKITKYTHAAAHNHKLYNGEPITKAIEFAYTPINKCIAEVCEKYLEN